jgi:hypothetical protein
MNDFILDIWNDLREKRLWPVAVLLLAGLIAVPVVLSKPAEEPTVAPVTAAPQAKTEGVAKGLAALTVAKDEPGEGSTLDVFDPSDPFKPPKDIVAKSQDDGTSTTTDSGSAATTDTGAATTDTGGGGGTTTTETPAETPAQPETQTVEYRYVADITFTNNGKKRKIKGLERLDVLPGEKNPLLIFLGAGKNGNNAVFLVDSTLTAAGEGKCRPSRDECAFLFIGAGSVEELTNDDGDSYTIRVDQIRKVKVGDDESSSKAGGSKTKANAAVGSEPASRRFVPPLITDLISVEGGSDELSDEGQ